MPHREIVKSDLFAVNLKWHLNRGPVPMRFRTTFRTIWKIDSLIILVGGAGICIMLGVLAFQVIRDRLRTHQKEDTVNVESSVGTSWRLGAFEKISGYMVAPVYSAQSYSVSLYGKQASAVRNYLFVNLEDKSSRWLIPTNDHLIVSMERLAADGTSARWADSEKPAKWLVFDVVTSDTNGDNRLTEADRKTIGIAGADGSHYAEVLSGIDAELGRTWMQGDRLLIVYSAGGKNVISEISLPDRKVLVTRDLPKIGG
jgi:hypothetical protein